MGDIEEKKEIFAKRLLFTSGWEAVNGRYLKETRTHSLVVVFDLAHTAKLEIVSDLYEEDGGEGAETFSYDFASPDGLNLFVNDVLRVEALTGADSAKMQ